MFKTKNHQQSSYARVHEVSHETILNLAERLNPQRSLFISIPGKLWNSASRTMFQARYGGAFETDLDTVEARYEENIGIRVSNLCALVGRDALFWLGKSILTSIWDLSSTAQALR